MPTSSEIAGIPSPISTPIENVGVLHQRQWSPGTFMERPALEPRKWKVKENELRSMHQQQLDTIKKIHWDNQNSTEFVRSEEALKTLSDIQNDMLPKAKDLCSNEGINATDTEIRQSLDIVLTDRMELQGHARWRAFYYFNNALRNRNSRAWAELRSQIQDLLGTDD